MTADTTRDRRRSRAPFPLLGVLLVLVVAGALGWCAYVYEQIEEAGSVDQATHADAIAVFGAAEYDGRPSPVFHARLDHAVELFQQGIAPEIVTLGGGADRNSGKSEGGVGRDYLLARGVPFADIIAETQSVDTEQQVHRLAAIARDHGFSHVVVVSDATHMLRIRELCEAAGLQVYTSPRASVGRIDQLALFERYGHEILSYTSLRLHLHGSSLHRWYEGRGADVD